LCKTPGHEVAASAWLAAWGTPLCTDKYIPSRGLPDSGRAGLFLPGSKAVRGGDAAYGAITQSREYSAFLPGRMTDFIKQLGNEVSVV